MKIKVDKHTTIDKSFCIHIGDWEELHLTVDYDDVDHQVVDQLIEPIINAIKELPTPEIRRTYESI